MASSALPQPLHHRVQPAGGQDPVLGQHVEVTGPRILRQVADLAGAAHRARRRLRLPGQDPGQRGLARPVPPDQPDLVPGRHLEGGMLQQQAGTRPHLEILRHQHHDSVLFVHRRTCRHAHNGRRISCGALGRRVRAAGWPWLDVGAWSGVPSEVERQRNAARRAGLESWPAAATRRLDVEAESPQLIAAVVGDLLHAPRGHPHPVDHERVTSPSSAVWVWSSITSVSGQAAEVSVMSMVSELSSSRCRP